METRHLLAAHAELMNQFGPDSKEVESFLNKHKDNESFCELAKLAKDLKVALCQTYE